MADQSDPPCIVWFRDDLRLSDHPALHAAVEDRRAGDLSLCVRRSTRARRDARPLGGAARWWLAQSLRALQKSLARDRRAAAAAQGTRGQDHRRTGARDRRRRRCSGTRSRRRRIRPSPIRSPRRCRKSASPRTAFPAISWPRPRSIRNKEGRGLRVFTPFWRRVQALGDPPDPLPAPKTSAPRTGPCERQLESWRLEPTHPDWAGGLRETWTPGEASAQTAARRIS